MEIQVSLLWALQNNYFDDIAVDKIVPASTSLQEYLETAKEELLGKILAEKKLTDDITAGLKEAVETWKSTFEG